MKTRILNSEGKPVVLNRKEQFLANQLQAQFNTIKNALGYNVDITTLTQISKRISEQKFYKVAFADYVPVVVGEGAWSDQILNYRTFATGDSFEKGIINTGSNNGKLASTDAGVDSVTNKVINWAKEIGWTLPELAMASRSGNWDIVSSKEKSRKMNWDLGLQQVAFLGLASNTNIKGLLNLVGITTDTTTIPKPIKDMTPAELKTMAEKLLETYRSNCGRTAYPSALYIPESDYNGLLSPTSPDFPIKSALTYLREILEGATMNPNFKILPLAYGDAAHNNLGKQRYVMLNADEESVKMDIPVDYTNTLANSINNFSFQNVGYGQFTGVIAIRPLEIMYYDHTL